MAGRLSGPIKFAAIVAIGFVVIIAVCASLVPRRPKLTDADAMLTHARNALKRRDFATAEQMARQAIEDNTTLKGAAWIVAGEATVQQKKFEEAVTCFLNVVECSSQGEEQAIARALAGDILARQLHRLRDAEAQYRLALEASPKNDNARLGLSMLLAAEGRRREAEDVLLSIVRDNRHSEQHLFLLGNSEWIIESLAYKTREGDTQVKRSEFLELSRKAVPDDLTPTMGLARLAEVKNQAVQAIGLLESVIEKDPGQIEAWAMLGGLLARTGEPRKFLDWNRRLPEAADDDPRTWFARATWATRLDQDDVAARCLWECLARDPNHLAANLQLAQALDRLGRTKDADPFRLRASRLSELTTLLRGLAGDPRYGEARTEDRIRRVVKLNRELGRAWEAVAWSMFAMRNNQHLKWPQQEIEELRPFIKEKDLPRTIKLFTPLADVDLSDLPAPDWTDGGSGQDQPRQPGQSDFGPITYRDDAPATGLAFRYYNDALDSSKHSRLPETMGGGAGVLDLDNDGWPDLYFAQGNHHPVDPSLPTTRPRQKAPATTPTDRLFRNTGTGTFEDITEQAGLAQDGYGQGVTVGDVNGDGFADVHVANIGGNRLLINNGDGTFTDDTQAAGVAGKDWSITGVIADLNNDGLADLYVVNYLSGQDVFLPSCPPDARNGRPCGPGDFDAAQDRFYLNAGNGRFVDATDESGIVRPEGKGLGVVAADFDGNRRLDLFVANDTRANFLFRNLAPADNQPVSLVESAMRAGLAFSAEGEPEGCMGIAVGDVDGDGTLDLFVTNYVSQSNTLYSLKRTRTSQTTGGFFLDRTRPAGLFDNAFSLVGWGTEFLDADLDGDLDLLVTNGHLNGHLREGEQLAMPPLCYRNNGTGQFSSLAAEQLGPYFGKNSVGRGLAVLDWNNDGRCDALVTHLDAPASLLTNTTGRTGRHVVLRLVGTSAARDAVGTTVTARSGDRSWVMQLTAGDGYLVSNQRQLVIGTGAAETLDEITIAWPSGTVQTLGPTPTGQTLVVVENGQAVRVGVAR